jgi:DNA primase
MPLIIQVPTRGVDFDAVRAAADLPALMAADGIAIRRGMALCPFHDNTRTPSLSVFQRRGCWWFKCHSCGAKGDAIDYVARRDGIGRVEAARALAGIDPPRPRRARPPAPTPAKAKAPATPIVAAEDWQAAIGELVERAEDALWSAEGQPALEWLRGRGLADFTIGMFRLGWLEAEGWTSQVVHRPDGTVGALHFVRGVLLPWVLPDTWYSASTRPDGPRWAGANVRRLGPDLADPPKGEAKYRALRGSERGHLYPHADLLPTQGRLPFLLTEGELDALLCHQELGHLLPVATVGGASQSPRPEALAALRAAPVWLLGFDHDPPGAAAALSWWRRDPAKARRVMLPFGKDATDFDRRGGDLRGWLAAEYARFGWPSP